jgi:hypothetical protein
VDILDCRAKGAAARAIHRLQHGSSENEFFRGKSMKFFSYILVTFALLTSSAFGTVVVSSPSNGSTVGSAVQYIASATTSCSKGVASVGVYVDNNLAYVVNGTSINTSLSLALGSHRTVVQEWDYCGGVTSTVVNITVNSQAGVSVTSPENGSTVSSPALYTATATTSCSRGVAAMGIYVNNQLAYVTQGATLSTQLSLSAGSQNTVVQEWDNCGGTSAAPINVSVGGTTLYNLQASGGWNQWGELAPVYSICSPCSGVNWSMYQHVSSVSLSGNATKFTIGGTTPYSDVLWSNPIMGQGSTQNLADPGHTLIPNLHNFVYDAYVYVTNYSVTQDLEFDINMYLNGVGMEWGTQCNHLADGDWDIWNNVEAKWVSSGAPCSLNNNAWNHVVVQVQREANNDLLYQTITVNGVTYNIDQTVSPFPVPPGWYGMTINYQMDGNYNQATNTTYLDNLKLTYW